MKILTDEEISAMWLSLPAGQAGIANDFARAIEAAIIERIGEPVSYRWWNDEFKCWFYDDAESRTDGAEDATPLFAIKGVE